MNAKTQHCYSFFERRKGTLMIKKLAFYTTVISLVGCASAPPTPAELSNADYGRPTTTGECTTIAEAYIKSTLKDPSSAQFNQTLTCHKGALKQSLMEGGSWIFGYLQEGTVNAKNSYGGYAGFRTYRALIRNGVVTNYCTVDPSNGICM